VIDQVSHPYKTTNKIIILYILIFEHVTYIANNWHILPLSYL
jgi:hypothetical protein